MREGKDEIEQEFILGNREPFITHLYDNSPSTVYYEAPLQITFVGQRTGLYTHSNEWTPLEQAGGGSDVPL